MLLTPPPVTNCHTFSDPLPPLERDVLYGRPLNKYRDALLAESTVQASMGVFRGATPDSKPPKWIRYCYKSLNCIKISPKSSWKDLVIQALEFFVVTPLSASEAAPYLYIYVTM